MKKYPDEFKDTFLSEFKKGKSLNQISKESGISTGTLSNWKNRYLPKTIAQELKEEFIRLYILHSGNISEVARLLGITRQTAARYKNRYFAEIPCKRKLFIKLVKHEQLSINEIAFLLTMHRLSVIRFYKDAGLVPDELK